MNKIIEKLEIERQKNNEEAKKYPIGDKRNMYYIGCAVGISKALTKLQRKKEYECEVL